MNKNRLFWLHLGIVLLAWLFLVQLHWQNDGLWMQGDSPRHAANGLFWKDMLLSGSLHPIDYALRYYARYPVISPANYPPVFYILEGAVFGLFHASPYLAKGLVLVFALFAAIYLMAWIRRWIAEDAAWMACLLLLLPGFVRWSHAVMLNVPSAAFSLAALYHARRWIEEKPGSARRRQLYLTAAFSVLATLTYFPAAIVMPVIAVWLLILRRWDLLMNWRTIFVCLVVAALFGPWLCIAFIWAPVHVSFVTESFQPVAIVPGLTYYLKALPELAGPYLLYVAGIGLSAGAACRRWRPELFYLLTLLMTAYVALSGLVARESRYALLLCVPIVCFSAIAFQALKEWSLRLFKGRRIMAHAPILAVALALSGTQTWVAAKTAVSNLRGMTEVVAYISQVAPAEPVLYDGYYDGVFTFYLRSTDPDYRRRVVLGAKLLYASGLNPSRSYRSFVASTEDVVRVLQTRGGCRWLVIEMGPSSQIVQASRVLRRAVQGPDFELVRTFPLYGRARNRIEVYRFKRDPDPIDEVDLPFPVLGEGTRFKTRPMQR